MHFHYLKKSIRYIINPFLKTSLFRGVPDISFQQQYLRAQLNGEKHHLMEKRSRNELKISTQIRNPSYGGNCFNYTLYIKRQLKKEQD